MKNSNNNMKLIMENWRAQSKPQLRFTAEERQIIKEHKLTHEQVQQMIDEGKWDDFKGWAGKKAKGVKDAAKGAVDYAKEKGSDAIDYAKEKGVKGMAADAKGAAGGAADWAKGKWERGKRLAKGAAEIGFGGSQSTNLGGEEFIDIDKRNAQKAKGAAEIERNLKAVDYEPLNKVFQQLKNDDWPNFKGGTAVEGPSGEEEATAEDEDGNPLPPTEKDSEWASDEIEKGGGRDISSSVADAEKTLQKYSESKIVDEAIDRALEEINEAIIGHSQEFKMGVEDLKGAYEEIKNDYDSGEKNEETLKTANERIAVLRSIVIYFQDYVLADQGSYLREQEEEEADTVVDAEEPQTIGSPQGAMSKNYSSVYSAKFPASLMMAGAAAGAAGFAMDSDWMQDFLKGTEDLPDDVPPEVIEDKMREAVVTGIDFEGTDGLTQAIQRASGVDLGPDAPISNFLKPEVQKFLEPDLIAQYAQNPEALQKGLDYMEHNAAAMGDTPIKNVFGLSGPLAGIVKDNAMAVKQGSFETEVLGPIIKKGGDAVRRQLEKGGMKGVKKMATSLGGPVLMGIGAGFLGGGLASAAMRAKGKYGGSKMASLKDLVDSFKDLTLDGEEVPDPVVPPTKPTKGDPVDPDPVPEDTLVVPPGKSVVPPGPDPEDTLVVPPGPDPVDPDPVIDEPKVGPGKGQEVFVYKKGPHISGGDNKQSLTNRLMDLKLPTWALHAATGQVKKELEANGFVVKEGRVYHELLKELTAAQQKELEAAGPVEGPGEIEVEDTVVSGEEKLVPPDPDPRPPEQQAADEAGEGINSGDVFTYRSAKGAQSAVKIIDPNSAEGSARVQVIDAETCEPTNRKFATKKSNLGEPIEKCSVGDEETTVMGTGTAVGEMPHEKGVEGTADAAQKGLADAEEGTFKVSAVKSVLGNPPEGEQPLDPAQLKAVNKLIVGYVQQYLTAAGLGKSIRESKINLIEESVKKRWKVLSGIR